MTNLDNLMFRREHFPIGLHEASGIKGKKFWGFRRIEIPPYHPSMASDGIDFQSVPDLLDEALEATVKDLEEIGDKRMDIKSILQDVMKEEGSGKILYDSGIIHQDELGIVIESIPIVNRVYIGKDRINPYGQGGDQGIGIYPEHAAKSFMVPENVTFSEELMREYNMKEEKGFLGFKRISCPNGWYRHNLAKIDGIFYKNLVISLDNAIIKGKK